MSRVFGFPRYLKISSLPLGLFILLLGLLAPLLIAARGGDDPTTVPLAAATNTPQPPAPTAMPAMKPTAMPAMEGPNDFTVRVSSQRSLGSYLVDADGMTLYLSIREERNASYCSSSCADAWPSLLAGGAISAGEGLYGDRLTTTSQDDGADQVVYNGYPLYGFANDENPSDTSGQDRGRVWFVVSTDGSPIAISAAVNVGLDEAVGAILMDPSGRTWYLFTRDERDVSNCAGGCALAWPSLLTVDAPTGG